jgi:serine/threonine protein kinase
MMCLEYCETDLQKLIRGGKCTKELVQRLFPQMADGMAYVHAQIVIRNGETIPMRHLDLKPENILLKNTGEAEYVAKVADFGWQPDISPDEWTGTTHYMAPEFAVLRDAANILSDAHKLVSRPADVFSFGVMLWQVLSETPVDEWTKGSALKLSNIPKSFCANLTLLIEACWESDPEQRPTFEDLQRLFAVTTTDWFEVASTTKPTTARAWLNALGYLIDAQIDEAVAYTQEEGEPKALIEMETEDFDEMVEEMKVSTAFHILYDVYQPRL